MSTPALLFATLLVVAACSDATSDSSALTAGPAGQDSAPSTAPSSADDTDAATTTPNTPTTTPSIPFPPPGLAVDPASEVVTGDVGQLRDGGRWIYGMRFPSTLVRIDPETGELVELDLGLGESRAGQAQHVLSGGSVWVIGGPFRDNLVEVDPESMTEMGRYMLAEDHGFKANTPLASPWLTSLRSVRRFDPERKMLDDPVALEVDPVALAVGEDAVWVSLPAAAQVARVDAETGEATVIDTEPGPDQLVLDGSTLWVAHPPTASISRIDTDTGEVIGVTDVDIGGELATATLVTGLRPAPDGLWATVRYEGSPYKPVLMLLDRETGEIVGARSLDLETNSLTDHQGDLWLQRSDSGTLVRLDRDLFLAGERTPADALAPPTTTPAEPAGPTTTTAPLTASETALTEAFAAFVDPAVDTAQLGLDETGPLRDELIDLLVAQVAGTVVIVEATVDGADGADGIVVFDVEVDGGTVVLPGVELAFSMVDGTWVPNSDSVCALARGVGIECTG